MAENKKYNYTKELTKGFLKENPVLRLVLGTCPTLATTTSVINGIGMGIAATIVLVCSNTVISALRMVIPSKARIPAYIVIIASFVTMVQMLIKAFVPALDQSLGVFLPLIVVNCIILGRAEAYAGKNTVLASAVDGLGMGIGFTAALFLMGAIRELLGAGTFLSGFDTMFSGSSFTGIDFTELLNSLGLAPMTLFILPAGGFFVFGIIMAIANKLAARKGLGSVSFVGCKGCPHASFCAKASEGADTGNSVCIKDEEKREAAEISHKEIPEAEVNQSKNKEKIPQIIPEEAPKVLHKEKEEKPLQTTTIKVTDRSADEISERQFTSKPEKKAVRKSRKDSYVIPEDIMEPLPDVIPEFLRRDIEKNKHKEDTEE